MWLFAQPTITNSEFVTVNILPCQVSTLAIDPSSPATAYTYGIGDPTIPALYPVFSQTPACGNALVYTMTAYPWYTDTGSQLDVFSLDSGLVGTSPIVTFSVSVTQVYALTAAAPTVDYTFTFTATCHITALQPPVINDMTTTVKRATTEV